MNSRFSFLAAIFFLLVFSGNIANVRAEKLILGYIEFPPFTYTADTGEAKGILIDLAANVFPKAGYEFRAVSYPVKRLVKNIINGGVDIWMGLKTLPELKDTTYAGNMILAKLVLNAYTVKKNPPILKKEDLYGCSIIILRGYSYGGWINYIENSENKVRYTQFDNHEAAFRMLKSGRVDYLLDYEQPSEKALNKFKINNLIYNQISALPCYFIVSKKRSNGQMVIKKLEKILNNDTDNLMK